ncbi:hypothetical protein [Faunimonas pinastri]|nr:hypothetical protein [Faunimonas pinastri]
MAHTIQALEARRYIVETEPQWTVGRLVAALRDSDSILHGAATARLMQIYAARRYATDSAEAGSDVALVLKVLDGTLDPTAWGSRLDKQIAAGSDRTVLSVASPGGPKARRDRSIQP